LRIKTGEERGIFYMPVIEDHSTPIRKAGVRPRYRHTSKKSKNNHACEETMSRRKNKNIKTRSGFSALLRRPAFQLAMVAFVAFVIYLIASAGGNGAGGPAREVSVDEAYQMYQSGVFVLDVRTQEEWDEYHAPNATLIPLDQLPNRLNEVPKDQEILVVCRSGNRSQQGRDILLSTGYNATSMTGGLKEWYAKGYPIEGAPPQ
jgi:rhodanese-related sulfurtransferase